MYVCRVYVLGVREFCVLGIGGVYISDVCSVYILDVYEIHVSGVCGIYVCGVMYRVYVDINKIWHTISQFDIVQLENVPLILYYINILGNCLFI